MIPTQKARNNITLQYKMFIIIYNVLNWTYTHSYKAFFFLKYQLWSLLIIKGRILKVCCVRMNIYFIQILGGNHPGTKGYFALKFAI